MVYTNFMVDFQDRGKLPTKGITSGMGPHKLEIWSFLFMKLEVGIACTSLSHPLAGMQAKRKLA